MAKEHVVKEGAKVRKSTGDRIVDVIIYVALGLIALSTVLPFLYVVAGSFATEKELTEKAFFIIPTQVSLNAYQYAIRTANILRGLKNSIILTIMGTVMCMLFSLSFAYPLSKMHFRGRNWIMNLVIVTMLFSGGMIPSYMVINAYGLYDTYWALVLPALINPFNMVIIKKFFTGLPVELDEASYMDGANDLQIFTRVALPLSKPVIASISLFYGVGFWNDYFNSMIYLQTAEKFPIQIQLRSIILLSSTFSDAMMDFYDMNGAPPDKAVKMACTVIATVPVLCIYPFVQKYFTKGVMVGAVKG
ncbi:carbohydrate ABC transporter permease [Acetatifactor aquisgranensis]|jgi:putative aldouronate transport system permease protein|uniref:carbohydrate ABC transporter permease n=1 Tax=Acetatifactor aquisgranensis TaxID=2941233 RepID=UPI002041918A|nr:carbohydrate ABC transporter permease [Acetatifactor aquisgranensis]MCI9574075.1 carbohydrate ABC transporter permease [Lachnospiraceae bacterium]